MKNKEATIEKNQTGSIGRVLRQWICESKVLGTICRRAGVTTGAMYFFF